MKKKLVLLLSAVLVVGMLAGCGDKKEEAAKQPETNTSTEANKDAAQVTLKDGDYHAESPEFDEKSGWKETMDITVKDGKITAVNWDGVHKDGGDTKKKQSKDGKYGMKAGGASSEWHEQAEKMEQELIAKQDPAAIAVNNEGKTDAVSGVSIHVGSFVQLAQEALAKAK
ncbi:FMN-binding protein [Paenibacillus alvei]|uniref:FMN-binding protein n=1 Tax=Paenibacillus alvei TaxID=44250 RepID=A0AAP7DIG1_PAEAL|nr:MULTISPECIES: FMN-binding protein [Paenibacillus]EJW18537.1 major membrane immunogen, membrane-anchored lipoprotein [Paenibacillus alvei DSM 29]MBG9735171.1 lipoprotein [Paenibacillus alvei]MBG9743629.1 lipoprotein [Paenibacillus alvei]MCY7485129.1 FMN-binding protein [Paenibacillus alvei]MCY9539702.1 FMN-binding protein [Paenibacillus alvei]